MELKDAIYGRRSVRKYRPDPVSHEILQELLEGACMAPSGVNLQPWYFLALTGEKERDTYLGFMEETFARFRPVLEARFAKNPEVVEETEIFTNSLGGAPVVILAFLQKKAFNGGIGNIQSTAAAIQNLLLLAHEKGLATCWMTASVVAGMGDKLREAFAPDKGDLMAVIALGYADEAPIAPPRKPGRFDIL